MAARLFFKMRPKFFRDISSQTNLCKFGEDIIIVIKFLCKFGEDIFIKKRCKGFCKKMTNNTCTHIQKMFHNLPKPKFPVTAQPVKFVARVHHSFYDNVKISKL